MEMFNRGRHASQEQDIRERVETCSGARSCSGPPRDAAVEEVGRARRDQCQARERPVAAHGEPQDEG